MKYRTNTARSHEQHLVSRPIFSKSHLQNHDAAPTEEQFSELIIKSIRGHRLLGEDFASAVPVPGVHSSVLASPHYQYKLEEAMLERTAAFVLLSQHPELFGWSTYMRNQAEIVLDLYLAVWSQHQVRLIGTHVSSLSYTLCCSICGRRRNLHLRAVISLRTGNYAIYITC